MGRLSISHCNDTRDICKCFISGVHVYEVLSCSMLYHTSQKCVLVLWSTYRIAAVCEVGWAVLTVAKIDAITINSCSVNTYNRTVRTNSSMHRITLGNGSTRLRPALRKDQKGKQHMFRGSNFSRFVSHHLFFAFFCENLTGTSYIYLYVRASLFPSSRFSFPMSMLWNEPWS